MTCPKTLVSALFSPFFSGCLILLAIGAADAGASDIRFNSGLSVSKVRYSELDQASYQQMAIVARMGATYEIPESRWALTGSVYGNLTTDYSVARFFGGELGSLFRAPASWGAWQCHVVSGFFYRTMTVPSGGFGYRNLLGPQLYPVFQRHLRNGDLFTLHGRYLPVANYGGFGFSNREFGLGGAYVLREARDSSQLEFTADYSNIQLNSSAARIGSRSIAFGMGFLF